MLLTCEVIYGQERGRQLRACIEGATGQPCPCRQGQACPLMADVVPAPREPEPA